MMGDVKAPATASTAPGIGRTVEEFDVSDPMPEQWRPVVGYEGLYEVSDHGNVRSLDRWTTGPSGVRRRRSGKPMKKNLTSSNRYPMVQLCRNGTVRGIGVHRLVAMAFLGVPDNADELHVCHYDGDRQNNHISNLRWGTPTDNFHDMQRHGRDRITEYLPPPMEVCQRQHEMTPENTYLYEEGGVVKRRCRECGRLRDRRRYRQKPPVDLSRRTHGRIATYIAGCRCVDCKAAAQQWKAQRKTGEIPVRSRR